MVACIDKMSSAGTVKRVIKVKICEIDVLMCDYVNSYIYFGGSRWWCE